MMLQRLISLLQGFALSRCRLCYVFVLPGALACRLNSAPHQAETRGKFFAAAARLYRIETSVPHTWSGADLN